MAIFSKKTPLQELEAEHERLKRQRDRLANKTQAARSELNTATAAQLRLLTEAEADDAKAETTAQRRVDAAASSLKALEAALANINEQVSIAGHNVDDERVSIKNKAAADQIEKQISVFEKRFEIALTELRSASEAAGELAHVSHEIDAITKFALATGSELDVACSSAVHDLRNLAASVREGQARIPAKQEPLPAPQPAPVLTRVWVTKPIKFSKKGMVERSNSNCWVDLDPLQAAKAINESVAVALGHERAGKIIQTFKQYHGYGLPSFDDCHPLDDIAKGVSENKPQPDEVQPEPVVHSAFQQLPPGFERVDRGPGFSGTIKTHGPDVAA
jgi:hypothetical protein